MKISWRSFRSNQIRPHLKLPKNHFTEWETVSHQAPLDCRGITGIGFQQIIWTLYRLNPSDEEVLQWVEKFTGPFAVTMPKRRAVTDLPKKLATRSILTYVHTVNKPKEAKKYLQTQKVSEIYTDFLPPD